MQLLGFDDNDTCSDETLMARIKHWRNNELKTTDWTQLSDSKADKVAWATYRQALRDLPASNADPRKIVAPIKPA
jgi:hypothetical protein